MYHHLNGRPLQHFYWIEIVEEDGTQRVYFNSTIHVNRRSLMGVSYTTEFTHGEILRDRDLIESARSRYGDVYACTCYQ